MSCHPKLYVLIEKKYVFDIPILRSFLAHFLQRFPLISLLQTGKDIVIFCKGKTIELSIGTYRPFIVQIHEFTFFVKTILLE